MSRSTRLFSLALLGAFAIDLLPAQVPVHTAADDDGRAYGTWAAGDDYKVAFDGGMTFVPYLGKDYPENRPFSWRTASFRIGETELLGEGEQPESAAAANGWRYEYRFAAFTEAYDVRPDGVEQTFVIPQRLATGSLGTLEIRGAIATDLTAAPRGHEHAPLVFGDAQGNTVLRYGAAIAIDAAGEQCAMTTAFDDGAVTLRLDGEWLASATFPVVVDPLLGVFFASGGNLTTEVDVLHDPLGSGGHIWQTTTRWASANDSDVFLRRIESNGSSTPVYADTSSLWSSMHPSLGRHRYGACTLLAFVRHFHNSDTRKLRWHKHGRADFTLSTSFGSVDTGLFQAQRPRVASDLSVITGQYLLVVYQQENGHTFYENNGSEIWGAVISLYGAGSAALPFAIHDQTFEDAERPDVSTIELGGNHTWTVAYQVIGNSPMWSPHTSWDIEMRRVDRHGNVSAETVIASSSDRHDMGPKLAGLNDTLFLGYTNGYSSELGSRPTEARGTAIVTERREWNGASFDLPYSSYYTASTNNLGEWRELCDMELDLTTRSHCARLIRYDNASVLFTVTGYQGRRVHGELAYAGGWASDALDAAAAFDENDGTFVLGTAYDSVQNATSGVVLDRYAHPTAAPIQSTGLGCGSGTLSWVGSQLIGDEDCEVRIDNIAPTALAAIVVGLQPYSQLLPPMPPVVPGCWQLVPTAGPGSLATLPIVIGSNGYDIDLPEALIPFTLYFQGVHFDASNASVYTTERLEVPLVK